MKLIAILSWFDEQPSWLAGVVAGLHVAEVSHVVAVDGAYALYPGGRAHSSMEQHGAIAEVCRQLGMGLTLHTPAEPFFGNEVEKRSLSLRLAETVAEPFEDWYMVVDADDFVVSAVDHMRRLVETDCDAGDARFIEAYGDVPVGGCPLRCFFRAIPGLAYEGNHYTVRAPDGRDLHDPREPAADLSFLEIEHRTRERSRYRKQAQQEYYARRDRERVESAPAVAA